MTKNKLFGFISAALFLLVGIFTLLKLYTLSYKGFSVDLPGLFKMEEAFAVIGAILLILVAVCGLVCALLGKYKAAMISAVVEFILFLIVFFVLKGKSGAASSYVHFTFIGWLHMIFTVAAGVLASLASKNEA